MRALRFAFVAWVALCGYALAQSPVSGFPPGTFQNRAALNAPAASYQGPGDVFPTSPYAWYSTARVFTLAQASTSTSLVDLVDSAAPTTTICTLRGTASGFVDLSAYCPGSVTPAAKCAAATGAVCNISKLYDQTGNGRDAVQTTAANQPTLTFSSTPSTTLPAINCGTAATLFMAVAGTLTQAQPLTMSAVLIRTTGTAIGGAFGSSSGGGIIGPAAGANLAGTNGGTPLTAAASDNTWYALQGLLNGASSAINVNGSDATGNAGTSGFPAATTIRLCRALASQHLGLIAEAGVWAATSTSTDRNNLNANQHSVASGYNF